MKFKLFRVRSSKLFGLIEPKYILFRESANYNLTHTFHSTEMHMNTKTARQEMVLTGALSQNVSLPL